jgi:hypothetical protein
MFNCYAKTTCLKTSIFYKRSLKIPKGYSDVINRRRPQENFTSSLYLVNDILFDCGVVLSYHLLWFFFRFKCMFHKYCFVYLSFDCFVLFSLIGILSLSFSRSLRKWCCNNLYLIKVTCSSLSGIRSHNCSGDRY